MLNLIDIIQQYPEYLRDRQEHILREYLQYHILESLFTGPFAKKLCFMGGTALRLCYANERFSEDLDFDNFDLSYDDFTDMVQVANKSLQTKGFLTEWTNVRKGAYHCNLKFPELLYSNGLAPMKNTKILVQIDTVEQGYDFVPDKFMSEKFDTLSLRNVVSPSLLLSQKLFACFERKRLKGRDFFDIVFLMKKYTKSPDYGYLQAKLGIKDAQTLTEYMITKSEGVDFDVLSKEVAPFLFDPHNRSVAMFGEYMKQVRRG